MTDQPDFERAKHYALARLEHELSPVLTYHSLAHTRDSVAPAAERLAALSGVDGEALLLLRTAAYFHDLGFTVPSTDHTDHEVKGVQIATQMLPGFGYSAEQVEQINRMIMATRLPQSPHNLLEQILADADLDVLGREDFWEWNRALRREMEYFSHPRTDEQWYEEQIRFLSAHRYWTAAARSLRDARKQQYLEEIQARVAQCRTSC